MLIGAASAAALSFIGFAPHHGALMANLGATGSIESR